MSEYCEILEELVLAESSCPATDIIVVGVSTASSSSAVVVGPSPAVFVSAAAAVSIVTPSSYALMLSSAQASSITTPSVEIDFELISKAKATSAVYATYNELVVSSAVASSSFALLDTPVLCVSIADSTSTVTLNTVGDALVISAGAASSSVTKGLYVLAISAAAATSTQTNLRTLLEFCVSTAATSSTSEPTGEPNISLLVSTADASAVVAMQLSTNVLLTAYADASSGVWYKDPGRVAWVVNTENTAACWYDNFDFESIAQTPTNVLAVGPDGLYELVGTTDSGEEVDAEVKSGFTDFGDPHTKRVDNMYFGYTSGGVISATTETYGSGHGPYTYVLEEREAGAPRNSRLTPGKGLSGRYWRFTIRNVGGVDFEVHDAMVDIAISSRRI